MKWRSLDESGLAADARSLREQFAERKELVAKYVPAEIQAIHARVIAELQQQRIAEGALASLPVLRDLQGERLLAFFAYHSE